MDSPRCIPCIENGRIGQTYRVAGKQMFKCQSCGKVTERAAYKDEDFLWRTRHDWARTLKAKLDAQKNKVGLSRMDKLMSEELSR